VKKKILLPDILLRILFQSLNQEDRKKK